MYLGEESVRNLTWRSVPQSQAADEAVDLRITDVVVVVAGVDFEAVEMDAQRGAAVKEGRVSHFAPVDFGRHNPGIAREPIAAVGEIEPEVASRRIR